MTLVGILIRIGIVLAIMGAIAAAVHSYNEHFRDQGRAEVRALWEADKAARIALTTGIVLEQTKRNKENDDAADQRKLIMDRDFSSLAVRADAGPSRPVSVPAASLRLQFDASRAANADRPKAAAADGGGKADADAVPQPAATEAEAVIDQRDSDAAWVKAANSYRDAFDLWLSCRKREDTCRATEEKLLGATP